MFRAFLLLDKFPYNINYVFITDLIGSIINWTDDKIHQSNFHVFE